jgi:hypothetical protein
VNLSDQLRDAARTINTWDASDMTGLLRDAADRLDEISAGCDLALATIEQLKRSDPAPSPIVVAIALSLYAYNVAAHTRAKILIDRFGGACMEYEELMEIFNKRGAYAATELAYPTAAVYVQHALNRYRDQAERRVAANESMTVSEMLDDPRR